MAEKKKQGKQKEEVGPEQRLISDAIQAGVYSLASQPGMRNYIVPLRKNIDHDKVYSIVSEIKKEILDKKIPEKQQGEFLYKNLASFIASGNAQNKDWEKIVIEKGYEGRENRNMLEKIVGIFKPHKFDGEKYFEKATEAYGDIYEMLAHNKTAQQKMPELIEASESLAMYGFLDGTLTSLKAKGLMDNKVYKELMSASYETALSKSQRGIKGIENYILSERDNERERVKQAYQKIVASILLVFGGILITFNAKITGAVIGSTKGSLSSLIGAVMIWFSLILFFRSSKKKL